MMRQLYRFQADDAAMSMFLLVMTWLLYILTRSCQARLSCFPGGAKRRKPRLHGPKMTKMFKIALPDGSVKEMPEGSTPADVAAAIGPGLAKAALAAKIDGDVRDIMRP